MSRNERILFALSAAVTIALLVSAFFIAPASTDSQSPFDNQAQPR